jgi:hypothetical protein
MEADRMRLKREARVWHPPRRALLERLEQSAALSVATFVGGILAANVIAWGAVYLLGMALQ